MDAGSTRGVAGFPFAFFPLDSYDYRTSTYLQDSVLPVNSPFFATSVLYDFCLSDADNEQLGQSV
jgi:hypothetical protein